MLTFPNVIVAMVTPFHEDGSVNYEAAVELAKKYADEGSAILVGATTGEGAVMTEEEKLKLFQVTADALKDKTLVMGNVGTNNTLQTIEMAKKAKDTGVDVLLCIVPYYNKPNQEGCYAHFAAIAKSTDLPIFIYNVPGRTGGKIEPQTVCQLAHDFPNIIGLKDASGDLDYAGYVAANAPEGFHLYSGDDNLTLPIVAVGGEGVISVAAHVIGKEMNEMIQAHKDGDVKKAAALHQKYLPFMKGCFCT
ncbi:MAG: 4-hydroxy-tetrahydrodipicolinate synthase, partial [Megasphaera elsdenii]|nr:4-hydroxy-tetrahydrodipicolinate synthase [Megasphaera elsdenii]